MNIIARHTFKCTGKNPVQSAIIIVSVIIITACILVALSVSPVFRATASTWAGASFAGSDAIISYRYGFTHPNGNPERNHLYYGR